jgi:UDP-N-acetylglucosamine diphosphorylase / glucose-1-phosphate thymidylyltransferase / UDP-N-acetylgalactosamine diphosphorylase / glucosamine-1-phosphate N-acetyltransferase / galactosamine-1-phosphate N-acetyltransferase
MRLCVFEDRGVLSLEPLTWTRPAFDLRCGAFTLLQRQQRVLAATETGVLVRPLLAGLTRRQHPDLAVNDAGWLRKSATVYVNARWLPGPELVPDVARPQVGMVHDEVAFAVLPPDGARDATFDNIDDLVQQWKQTLPRREAGGVVMVYPWDIVDSNPQALTEDFRWFTEHSAVAAFAVVGPREQVALHPSAQVDPFVAADTRKGPVIIDRGAVIHAFSRLEGPCYIGPESWILGAKLRGGSIGPHCRIGGEVEASVVHAYSNKYHDGFLGHSYVGEWVNLAAGTQTSDLRNDYGPIRAYINGVRIPTGRTKVGSFVGDHTKTGLNTLLNCGSVIGAFCGLLPTGTYLPTQVPSFTNCNGMMTEAWDLRQLFQTASTVMRRRGCELTDAHRDLYFALYDLTAEVRRRTIRDYEQRRLRRSV